MAASKFLSLTGLDTYDAKIKDWVEKKGYTTPDGHNHDGRYYTESEVNTLLNSYLKLAGGTMTSTAQIQRPGTSTSWYLGRSNAMIKTNSYSGYNAIASMKTTDGDWSIGVYSGNKLYFTYVTDTNFDSKNNTTTAQIVFNPDGTIIGSPFKGAGVSTAGTVGLVPTPGAGKHGSYLRGDGTWSTPTNTTYGAATQSAAGLMTAADKKKLDGIATGANAYSLPLSASGTRGGIQIGYSESGANIPLKLSSEKGYVTLTKNSVTTALGYTPPTTNTTYNAATQSAAGLMSAADKQKLDGIATGANNYTYTHPSSTAAGTKGATADVTGTEGQTIKVPKITVDSLGHVTGLSEYTYTSKNTTYSNATQSAAGLMTAADKKKLDGIANMTGAGASAAGKAGLVPAPAAGKHTSFLRGDGTWVVPTNTTYSNMTGAGASAAGKAGLVPAPAAGKHTSFLRGDGTWVVPTNTTYNAATQSAAGLMSAADKKKLDGIAASANAYSLPLSASGTRGGIQIGYTESGANIPLKLSSEKGYVTLTKNSVTTALGYTPPTTNTTYSFSNSAPTLAWNTTSVVGVVGGVTLTVKMPANPDTNTTYTFTNKAPTLAWNTTSVVGIVGGVTLTVKMPANPDTNTTYSNMKGAGASAAGSAGLVPAPAAGKHTSFLRGDGTWVVPTNTTYTFTNKAPTLAWNTTSVVGIVGGVTLTVKMPANPDTNTTYSFSNSAPTLSWGNTSVVGVVGGVTLTVKMPANPDTNTTYSNMKGAGASAAGSAGLVPQPAAGKHTSFLRGDGTWAHPTPGTIGAAKGKNVKFTDSSGGTNGMDNARVLAQTDSYSIAKGTWDYSGNGYLTTTGFGNIDLAGASILTFGGSSAYTQLFITAPTTSGVSSATANDILFYQDHGSGYSPGWTRILTNRNSGVSLSGSTLTVKINGTTHSLTNTNTTYSNATTSAAGLMSAADKTKLDGINLTGGITKPDGNTGSLQDALDALKTLINNHKSDTNAHKDTTYTFTNKAPTLAWNTTSVVGIVGGVTLTVKMPANPDTNTTYSFSNNAPTLAWNTTSTVGVVGGVTLTVKMPTNPNTTYTAGTNISISSSNAISSTDTKNTAGSTDISTPIYLIGASTQAANPQTYSHDTVMVNGDGRLEAKNAVVGGTISSLSSYYTEGTAQSTYSTPGSSTVGSSYVSLYSSNWQGGSYLYLQEPDATNRLEGYMYIYSGTKYRAVTVPAGKKLQFTVQVTSLGLRQGSSSSGQNVYSASLPTAQILSVVISSSTTAPTTTDSSYVLSRQTMNIYTPLTSTTGQTTGTFTWTNTGTSSRTVYIMACFSFAGMPIMNVKKYSSDSSYATSGTYNISARAQITSCTIYTPAVDGVVKQEKAVYAQDGYVVTKGTSVSYRNNSLWFEKIGNYCLRLTSSQRQYSTDGGKTWTTFS